MLATAGVYGVFSYWVSRRTSEIGVRMALGADAVQVERLVVVQGLRVTAVGLVVGLAGALASAQVLQRTFHGVGAADPSMLVSVSTLLVVAAALACYVPAQRASRIEPSVALRSE